MITTCTACQARYQLDDSRIPPRVIKVRCPSCSGVFTLDGTQVNRPATPDEPLAVTTGFQDFHAQSEPPAPEVPVPSADPAPEAPAAESPAESPPEADPEPTPTFHAPREPVATASPEKGDETAAAPETASETATAVMDDPAPRRRKSKEEMLARALVSDIMVYNRDLYDQAKAENNLLEALGAEIKKSWELYKEKVGDQVANDTDHFRTALNDILADGDKVF